MIFSKNMRRNLNDNVHKLFSKRARTTGAYILIKGEVYERETNRKMLCCK